MAEPITRNAYAILGVSPDSGDQTIAAAYRAMARRYHPDIAGDGGTDRMIRVNAAFERVRTADRRAEYDLELESDGIPWTEQATAAAPPMRPETDGTGGAGPPPGHPSGSVLRFGRHIGWSIGEIARADPGYLVWLEERREGRPYREEIDRILRATGRRVDPDPSPDRRGPRRR